MLENAPGVRDTEEKLLADRAALVAATYDALVLDAHLRQALVTVRSLGRRGLDVAALGGISSVPAFASRWCKQRFICPVQEGSEDYLAYLEQLLDENRIRVLIPCSDGTIALLRHNRQHLEQRVRIALAQEHALSVAVNKEQTLALARQLGLHIPYGVVVSGENDVPAAIREIGFPAVIKPVESWLEKDQQGVRVASCLVTTLDETYQAVETLTRHGGSVLFQQFLTGRREAVSFLYARGEIYARFAQWAKRTEPPLGGQSVLRQSIAVPPDIGAKAERLVREMGLEGYSEVEFRRDSAGLPYLMEINPRLSASVEIAVRCGVDFPLLLYQWANDEAITRVSRYRTGGWMRYLRGDIMTTIEALQQRGRPGVPSPARSLLDFSLSFLHPMDYDYLDWSDLLPAVKATVDFTCSWVGGAISKRLVRLRRKQI
jgi:predicted ATP-grasp superfamily ATP-dependent carboligase